MNFKNVLIVTDLDGTLLDDKKNIAEDDIRAINEFREGGDCSRRRRAAEWQWQGAS